MSTLPDFTGPGFFAGEAPDGLTTIAGTPTSAQVRVYWRDPADPQAPDVLVDSTQSAADGTWQIAGLNPALRYVVRAQKSQFDDVTVVGAAPSRSDVIAYVDQLVPREDEFGDVDGLTGHVLLDSGLPPFTCEVIEPLPYGLEPVLDGRKLLIEGVSTDNGLWESVVRVTASNGVWVDVPVQVQIQVLRDPHFDNVSLLLHMDGADGSTTFTDSSATPKAVTAYGNAKISTAQSKFGGASVALNGSTSGLAVNAGGWGFGAQPFCCEAWVYPRIAVTTHMNIVCQFDATNKGWYLAILGGGKLLGYVGNSTNGDVFVGPGATTVMHGVWHHVALTSDGVTLRIFLDGYLEWSGTSPALGVGNPSTATEIGAEIAANSRFFDGFIDELRITKGVARYTENFTPPSAPFPNR